MNKKIIWVLIIILVLGAAGVIGYLVAESQKAGTVVATGDNQNTENTGDETDTGLTLTLDGTTYSYNQNLKTFLFLGVDKNQDAQVQDNAGRGGQSDCLILFVLNTKNQTTTMLEISRDSMVDVDIYGITGQYVSTQNAQIALQYAYGDGEKKSCWLTKKKVTELMGDKIRIDGYISLNIAGIATLNDAIGGVRITVPEDYTDIDPAFVKGVTLTLDGAQAEKYVRYRDTNVSGSNVSRMERQTQYLQALFSQMQGKLDTATITKLQSDASPYLVTDMSIDQMKQISSFAMNETVYKVPGNVTRGAKHDEFVVDFDKLQKIMQKLFYNDN